MTLTDAFNFLIAALGLAFAILTVLDSRSLTGSFFKSYYRYMVGASIALMFGFIIEPIADMLGLTEGALNMAEHLHHTALVIASILFIYAGRILPKDAAITSDRKSSHKFHWQYANLTYDRIGFYRYIAWGCIFDHILAGRKIITGILF